MIRIVFGLSFDRSGPMHGQPGTGGILYAGPARFLQVMENALGLGWGKPGEEYLRIEQYRQLVREELLETPEAFFRASFEADQFATAAELLSRRDELVLAGFDFSFDKEGIPSRLKVLARLKHQESGLETGMADRLEALYQALQSRRQPFEAIEVQEPAHLLPPFWERLFARLEKNGTAIRYGLPEYPPPAPGTDLGLFQQRIGFSEAGSKVAPVADGSLVLLRGRRDTDLAAFVAKWLREEPKSEAGFLLTEASRALDNALVREGMPSLGVPSASLARPALQVLKLISVFLWTPLDPFKVLEFVSLALKPLEEELAARIAQHMAQTPGILSDSWFAMLSQYFREMESRPRPASSPGMEEIRRQYRFWFERKRYDIKETAPKSEALEMYRYLAQWAMKAHERGEGGASLFTLGAQASRIAELLDALPEDRLTRLDLERIVRTIFEAAPLQLRGREAGSMPYAQQAGALDAPVDTLIWWYFGQTEPDFFFSRWSKEERSWLEAQGIHLLCPEQQNGLLIWQRKRPFLLARNRLILVQPSTAEGKEVQPHPLMGDLEACFHSLAPLILDIDHDQEGPSSLLQNLPRKDRLSPRRLGAPSPFIELRAGEALQSRESETFSSLETLLYYPYQWAFRYKLQLKKSAILSIVPNQTLFGNLAHRLFEALFQQKDLLTWTKRQVEGFIEAMCPDLLAKEGAVFLLYGREPERVQLINRVQYAAWSLVDLLQRNDWQVEASELPLSGGFSGLQIDGRADLVLRRGNELAVVDLKWRGGIKRETSIRNEEDLQLVLYSHLLGSQSPKVHTAYFIMENGRMIARNHAAFKGINAVSPQADQEEVQGRILQRTEATLKWRMEQLENGRIEVRCAQTQQALERYYEESLLDFLEMRITDAPYDDYRVLINLVD
ncbi:MAG: PD-(D/E)XK nuclease family protein [Haliscomenobacter sp.]|nr:PD-(D/E)XK nuclease family protein [Haliscomenobacter sp.]